MELILDLLYLYVGIFSLYFFVLAIRSLSDKKFRETSKYAAKLDKSNLCVVLYSHDNYDALCRMLSQLNAQNYPANKFFIYLILDNCTDSSYNSLKESVNLRILDLNDKVTVGKDQAVSILLEKLREDESIDSYVFIDTDRFIEENFLENANLALKTSPVAVGQTVILEPKVKSFTDKIKISVAKFNDNFVRKSRALLGLADRVDSSILCIRKDFVEKVDALDLKNINTELKYSILIADLGYPCLYVPSFKAYTKFEGYSFERPSLSYRINLFKKCFTKMFSFNYKFTEFVCSLIAPSSLVVVTLSLAFLLLSAKYYFLFNFIFVFLIFSLLLISFLIGYIKSELHAKDFIALAVYPIYSILHILDNLPPYRFVKKYFLHKDDKNKNIQKYTVKVIASNGKVNIPCNLDLISDDGLAKVIFSFKKKKFSSGRQLRMVEALNELTSKLNDYGFHLKICYCCEYFSSIVDGTQNMVQGECNYEFQNKKAGEIMTTLLWNSCFACKYRGFTNLFEEIKTDNSEL